MSQRKIEAEQSRTLILDTTERLIMDEGYAAVSTRRVAAEAFLKPSLVHYYFRTTDELFLAVFERALEKHRVLIRKALSSANPLHAMWKIATDPQGAAATAEFNALINHRKKIGAEIARGGDEVREVMADEISRYLASMDSPVRRRSAMALATLVMSLGRSLAHEKELGMASGQDDAMAMVDHLLDALTPEERPPDALRGLLDAISPAGSNRDTRRPPDD